MLRELLREYVKHLPIEVARGAIMLVHLYYALGDVWVFDDFCLEVGRAELLDECVLVHFLALVEVVDLAVEEFVNE